MHQVREEDSYREPKGNVSFFNGFDLDGLGVLDYWIYTSWGNCPLDQFSFDPENLAPGSDRVVTSYVQEALQKRHGEKVISLVKLLEVYEQIARDALQDTPRTIAKNLGRALNANLIMVGTVCRYRDRVGRAAGVQSPASVAFSVYLVDLATGEMIWKANFIEAQQSLSENILDARAFLKKGAKWLSASELARYGVTEVFKRFPL